MTRSFESAGPDVKIRGTPSHIAEKYVSLARDALSSGDPVLAENYLQHAEHYNRIILTYREQQMSQGGGDPFHNGMRTHTLNTSDPTDVDEFSDEEAAGEDAGAQPQQVANMGDPAQQGQSQPQPHPQGHQPHQPRYDQPHQQRFDRPQRQDRDHRQGNRNGDGGNRYDRNDRNHDRHDRGDRQDFRADRGDRGERGDRNFRDRDDRRYQGQPGDNGDQSYRRRERFQPQGGYERDREAPPAGFQPQPAPVPQAASERPAAPAPALDQEQPAFLRRPVRRPRREETDAEPVAAAPRQPASEEQD